MPEMPLHVTLGPPRLRRRGDARAVGIRHSTSRTAGPGRPVRTACRRRCPRRGSRAARGGTARTDRHRPSRRAAGRPAAHVRAAGGRRCCRAQCGLATAAPAGTRPQARRPAPARDRPAGRTRGAGAARDPCRSRCAPSTRHFRNPFHPVTFFAPYTRLLQPACAESGRPRAPARSFRDPGPPGTRAGAVRLRRCAAPPPAPPAGRPDRGDRAPVRARLPAAPPCTPLRPPLRRPGALAGARHGRGAIDPVRARAREFRDGTARRAGLFSGARGPGAQSAAARCGDGAGRAGARLPRPAPPPPLTASGWMCPVCRSAPRPVPGSRTRPAADGSSPPVAPVSPVRDCRPRWSPLPPRTGQTGRGMRGDRPVRDGGAGQ